MAKNNKKIKDSLLDFDKLSATLKENTSNAVQELLKEGIRNGYMEILKEAEDDYEEDDYDEDEATDTEVDDTDATDDAQEDVTDVPSDEDGEGKAPEGDGDEAVADDATDETPEAGEEPAEDVDVDVDVKADGEDGDVSVDAEVPSEDDDVDMSDMDEYRVEDGYDLTQADDDDVVKVYKRLKDDDHVVVVNDGDKVSIEDKDTGAEYIVQLNDGGIDDEVIADDEEGFDGEDDFAADETTEDTEDDEMNEQFVYEVAMNEYDSHTGYKDDYQHQDVLTNDGMAEPSKFGRTIDKGVPMGTKKPWSGKTKKSDKPFEEEENLEEASKTVSRATYRHMGNKTSAPNNPGHMTQVSHRVSRKGQYQGDVKGAQDSEIQTESMVNKLKKALDENKRIVKENEALMGYLKKFKGMIREAAVTNYNLGQIIKLISENSTTKDEKREIITRFGNEANSIKASDALYESISAQLSKRTNPITESRSLTVESTQGRINETSIYMSDDMKKSLDLMARVCR